jgi:hypothetical protein
MKQLVEAIHVANDPVLADAARAVHDAVLDAIGFPHLVDVERGARDEHDPDAGFVDDRDVLGQQANGACEILVSSILITQVLPPELADVGKDLAQLVRAVYA